MSYDLEDAEDDEIRYDSKKKPVLKKAVAADITSSEKDLDDDENDDVAYVDEDVEDESDDLDKEPGNKVS
jgi:hypothetical protein